MTKFIIFIFLLFSLRSFALEQFDLEVIEQYLQSENKIPTITDSWNVNPVKLEKDSIKYKGQAKNRFNWSEIDEKKWLSFEVWKKNRKRRDLDNAWRHRQRTVNFYEALGKVIKCVGVCFNYRGTQKVKAKYLSQLKEGDEFMTDLNSYAWLFLNDGSLVRLSPKTSITLHEINFAKKTSFVMIRLNNGYMNFIPRKSLAIKYENNSETDLMFSPLMVSKANREYFMIKAYRESSGLERKQFTISKNPGASGQYEFLNSMIKDNNSKFKDHKSRYFLYTANYSIEGGQNVVSMFYQPNGKGIFSVKDPMSYEENSQKIQVVVGKRGYQNTDVLTPKYGTWYEVSKDGEDILPYVGKENFLNASLGFLKRIPSLLITRELWLKRDILPMLKDDLDKKTMASNFGYRLWNIEDLNELQKRVNFIREYTRRVETTNLKSLLKVLPSPKKQGLDATYIRKALVSHYSAVKNLYNYSKSKVYRLSDAQYYFWIIKNAR